MLLQATLPIQTSLADLPPYVLPTSVDHHCDPGTMKLNIIVEKGPQSDAMATWIRGAPYRDFSMVTMLAMGDEHAP